MQLSPELLLRAYAIGIFPMAESRHDAELDDFHVPRRLKRRLRRGDFEVRCDTAFGQVIRACALPSQGRKETWINPTIERLYVGLHEMGFAHSIETWRDGRLVGGLYGVTLGAAFFGESMFHRVTGASPDVFRGHRGRVASAVNSISPPASNKAASSCSTPSSRRRICASSAWSKSGARIIASASPRRCARRFSWTAG